MAAGKLAAGALPKLDPKLRMITNGSAVVNARRAEQSSVLAVTDEKLLAATPPLLGLSAEARLPRGFRRGHMDEIPTGVQASVFVELLPPDDPASAELSGLPRPRAQRGSLCTLEVPLAALDALAQHPRVLHVERGQALAAPTPAVSPDPIDAARRDRAFASRRIDAPEPTGPVLVGIVDVGGFDFSHPELLDPADPTRTRFVRIWDQGGRGHGSPAERAPKRPGRAAATYGAELRQEELNAALTEAPDAKVAPYDLEPQSQMVAGSHGTHVASIAAGNHGVCPQALVAGVLVALTSDDEERRRSFYDSTRVAHAIDYLIDMADEFSEQLGRPVPVSINVSLGTNGHAHDATAATSRWIDHALATPGRAISVAAGNAGQELAAYEGDVGYVMGRIHTSGQVAARDLEADVEWLMVGNGIVDVSENELEIWYSAQDRFAVSVRPPGGDWIGPVGPQQYLENLQLPRPLTGFLSIYNELYHAANGSNYVAIYLSPAFAENAIVGITAGPWIVRIRGLEVRDGRFDGWIERDDPRPLGRIGDKQAWSFPSFFAERSNVDESSVSSLACGRSVIAAANLDEAAERVHITSSQGPTRDRRNKPDVAAPGTDVVAANGFAGPDDLWIAMTGTSMASPFVCGVAARMLGLRPDLTAAQIQGIMQGTSRPLPGAGFAWLNDAGFGRINPRRCLLEALAANERRDLRP